MKSFIYNLFGKKPLRAYVVLFYYVPNQNKVFLSFSSYCNAFFFYMINRNIGK